MSISKADFAKLSDEIKDLNKKVDELDKFMRNELRLELARKFLTVALDNFGNVRRFWEVAETEASFQYIRPYLEAGTVQLFNDKRSLLEAAVASATQPGLFLEFGVAYGRSINFMSRVTDRTVHGFDSFEGLPEDWGVMAKKGAFAQQTLPEVNSNVKLHIGLFDQTLPGFLEEETDQISLLHLDADLYSSTTYVLGQVKHRIVPGTIIVFDEYLNYPNWRQGEFKAFAEFVAEMGVKYRYLSFNCFGRNMCQAVVVIDEIQRSA